ncbi:hypothetical protein ACWGNZ_07130 [Sphingomonas zeae]
MAVEMISDGIGEPIPANGTRQRTLAEGLARYMDTKAFDAVRVGKEQAERLRARRDIANKRAKAAIRFFEKPENFARLQARIQRNEETARG